MYGTKDETYPNSGPDTTHTGHLVYVDNEQQVLRRIECLLRRHSNSISQSHVLRLVNTNPDLPIRLGVNQPAALPVDIVSNALVVGCLFVTNFHLRRDQKDEQLRAHKLK